MGRKKKEEVEVTKISKKKPKKEKEIKGLKEYYCVVDKQYNSKKKTEEALRFIYIRIEEHSSKPDNKTLPLDHAVIHYSWFTEEQAARNFKAELLQS